MPLRNVTTVRPIQETDFPGFHAAINSVCRERKFLARVKAPSLDKAHRLIVSNLKSQHPQFVAENGSRIVGWCDVVRGQVSTGRAHVGRLGMGVIKEFRSQGIGLRLLGASIAATREVGLEKIELAVYSSNTSAIALYHKLGFHVEGTKKDGRLVDGIYEDIILMAFPLKSPNKVPIPGPGEKSPRGVRSGVPNTMSRIS